MADPEETVIRGALRQAGIHFTEEHHPDNHGLDFYLPDARVHIEVKQFHSERIAGQMARVPNVIAVQGSAAVLFLAALLWNRSRSDAEVELILSQTLHEALIMDPAYEPDSWWPDERVIAKALLAAIREPKHGETKAPFTDPASVVTKAFVASIRGEPKDG